MPKAPLLTPEEAAARLETLRSWVIVGTTLTKRFEFTDFRGAVDFLDQITPVADEQNHHPDVAIHWNEVTLTLWTHASGGLTERDFRLATTIDQITEV
jgi:4a-hydroxytetrahydrobiopterin dehydratase